jgi:hypothetical protein
MNSWLAQPKREERIARHDRHVLLAIHGVGHRACATDGPRRVCHNNFPVRASSAKNDPSRRR